jgi:hypothetical protein
MIKCLTLAALHATLLGGCVVAPYGYRDYDDHHYWRHDDYRHDYYDLGYYRREWWNH